MSTFRPGPKWTKRMKIMNAFILHLFYVWSLKIQMEGLQDAVRNHTSMILPRSLVSFFYSAVWRKTTNPVIISDSLHNRISISLKCVWGVCVCANTLVTRL